MPSARKFSTILGIVLALFAGIAQAQVASSGKTYTVGGIDVDVTGADAIQARQKGDPGSAAAGHQDAGRAHGAGEDRARVPPIDDARLGGLVRGTEFQRERSRGQPLHRHA